MTKGGMTDRETARTAWARRLAALLILALPLALGACGKKGSLRLPDAPASAPAATAPAPAARPMRKTRRNDGPLPLS